MQLLFRFVRSRANSSVSLSQTTLYQQNGSLRALCAASVNRFILREHLLISTHVC